MTPLYGGGSILAERVYRDIFNCYGSHAGGDTLVGLTGNAAQCNTVAPYNPANEPLYVGSGNGKAAFVNHDPSRLTDGPRTPDAAPVPSTRDFGPFYGKGTGAGWVPNSTDAGPFFPSLSFATTEEPVLPAEIAAYGSVSGGHWGAPIQIPGFITSVAVPYQPAAGWKENGDAVAGTDSQLNLATDTLCGIFTGEITSWSDNGFKTANGGTQLGTGAIRVVYRRDGGGGTFLFTNALIHQCAFTSHPVPAAWQTAPGNSTGTGNDLFFANVARAGLLPANFVFVQSGQTMQAAIKSSAGSIGYDAPDAVLFVNPAGTLSANLQVFATLGSDPVFLAPIARNTGPILAKIAPPSSKKASCDAAHATGTAPFILAADGICADNPLNWGLAFPTPAARNAYPIGGFTFIDTYTCPASAASRDAIAGTVSGHVGLLRWFFGSAGENASHSENRTQPQRLRHSARRLDQCRQEARRCCARDPDRYSGPDQDRLRRCFRRRLSKTREDMLTLEPANRLEGFVLDAAHRPDSPDSRNIPTFCGANTRMNRICHNSYLSPRHHQAGGRERPKKQEFALVYLAVRGLKSPLGHKVRGLCHGGVTGFAAAALLASTTLAPALAADAGSLLSPGVLNRGVGPGASPSISSPLTSPALRAQNALSAANLARAAADIANMTTLQAAASASSQLTLGNAALSGSSFNGTPLSGLNPRDSDPTTWINADRLQKDASTATATVKQTATNALLTWQSFDLNKGEKLVFDQQGNSDWTVLNRVVAGPRGADGSRFVASPSMILGTISAPGSVYVINPNGVIFGPTAQINVHSLIASSLDVGAPNMSIGERNSFFLNTGILGNGGTVPAESFSYNQNDQVVEGDVVVQAGAKITASLAPRTVSPDAGGFVYLLAPNVENRGTISTPAGETLMVAAQAVQLIANAYPDGFAAADPGDGLLDLPGGGREHGAGRPAADQRPDHHRHTDHMAPGRGGADHQPGQGQQQRPDRRRARRGHSQRRHRGQWRRGGRRGARRDPDQYQHHPQRPDLPGCPPAALPERRQPAGPAERKWRDDSGKRAGKLPARRDRDARPAGRYRDPEP